ncbi:shikimate dehydrogenase, partial [bacterium]|nr:shikimate dehydrogenase [bacterium]
AGAAEVILANRTRSKLDAVAREVERTGVPCACLGLDRAALATAMERADLVVNATSVGLQPGDSLDLDPAAFSSRLVVYDTIYRPAETALLCQARAAGARAANGLSMLLHQGARAFEIWTGQPAPLAVMRDALRAAMEAPAS